VLRADPRGGGAPRRDYRARAQPRPRLLAGQIAVLLARGNDSTVEDYVAAIDYVIRIAGEDNVGIGTDFTQDQDDAFFEYLCLDKGYGWRVTGPLSEVVNPAGMRTIGDFPNLTAAMEHAGWPEAKIRKVMGENWLRLLAEGWAPLPTMERTLSVSGKSHRPLPDVEKFDRRGLLAPSEAFLGLSAGL